MAGEGSTKEEANSQTLKEEEYALGSPRSKNRQGWGWRHVLGDGRAGPTKVGPRQGPGSAGTVQPRLAAETSLHRRAVGRSALVKPLSPQPEGTHSDQAGLYLFCTPVPFLLGQVLSHTPLPPAAFSNCGEPGWGVVWLAFKCFSQPISRCHARRVQQESSLPEEGRRGRLRKDGHAPKDPSSPAAEPGPRRRTQHLVLRLCGHLGLPGSGGPGDLTTPCQGLGPSETRTHKFLPPPSTPVL